MAVGRMRRVATYERVSSENQKERETILTQAEQLHRRLADDPEVHIVERYTDDGVSGATDLFDRPDGRRLRNDATAGRFDEVWVYKTDRLGRDDIDPLIVRRELKKLGVKLCALHENIEGDLEYSIRVAIAAEERRTRRGTQQSCPHRAKRQDYLGGLDRGGFGQEDLPLDCRGRLEL